MNRSTAIDESTGRYPLDNSAGWDSFRQHLMLAEGYSFVVLLVPDDDAAAFLRERTQAELVPAGIHRIRLEADAADGFLAEQVLALTSVETDVGMIWIDGDPIGAEDFDARDRTWERNWSRLNRYRNVVIRQWQKPLVVCGAFRIRQVVRDSAPDFWRMATMLRFEFPGKVVALPPASPLDDRRRYDFGEGGDPERSIAEAERLEALPGREPEAARFYARAARQYYQRVDFRNAITSFERASEIDEVHGGDPEFSWELHTDLGRTLERIADYNRAEYHLRRSLDIAAQLGSPKHKASSLNHLGELLHQINRLPEAEGLYQRALAIDEASYGPDHPEVAIRLNNLAVLFQETNRLADAEPLVRRALAIDEASYGPDHPEVATDLNNLAMLLQSTNRLAEAEPLYRRALAISEASYGPDHPEVATDLNNLAGLLQSTNRLAEAEPLYRRGLAISEASYGPDHPTVAIGLNNLAELLQATNRLAEAEPLIQRALATDEASYGPDHPTVATRLNSLAVLLEATNRLAEAEPLYRRGLAILQRFQVATGHQHPNFSVTFDNYANFLMQQHKLSREQADERIREELGIGE